MHITTFASNPSCSSVYVTLTMSSDSREFSQEQQATFDKIVVEKKNTFFTGCAGTGKSFLLKCIIKHFQTTGKPEHLAVTASTGRAAVTIGGTTLHSFAGIGLGNDDIKSIINRVTFNKKVNNRWSILKVLIIDEISMLDADYFDKLDKLSKSVRKSSKPFGGIQLVVTGDLLQLPPVSEGAHKRKKIFQADCWKQSIDEYIVLCKIFRQEDLEFAEVLTYIRFGEISDSVTKFMKKLSEKKEYDSESGPVNLYATTARANKHNLENLNKIKNSEVIFKSIDKHKAKRGTGSNPLDNCPALPELRVKIGAQVMLIKNINKTLVNGTVGTVVGFTEPHTIKTSQDSIEVESVPIVRFDLVDGSLFTRRIDRQTWSQTLPDGEHIASRTQIPLILAWAITIHKSQGQTIQRLRVDLSDVFESGQVYTALSRAVSPHSLEVINFDPNNITVDNDSLEFCIENDLI